MLGKQYELWRMTLKLNDFNTPDAVMRVSSTVHRYERPLPGSGAVVAIGCQYRRGNVQRHRVL